MIPSGSGRCRERAPSYLNTYRAMQEGNKCTLAQPLHMRKLAGVLMPFAATARRRLL